MGVTSLSSPLIIEASANSSSAAPSLFYEGTALFDPRFNYLFGASGGNNTTVAYGIGPTGHHLVLDQVPSQLLTNNIAAAANPASGTAMTLVSGTGGVGITKLAAAFTIPQSGNVVPAGCLVIDGNPAIVTYGQIKAVGLPDPTTTVSRAISFTGGNGSAAGGAVKIVGYDLYGNLIHETVTVAASTATTNSVKAYKFIKSITPQYTDTYTIAVGTSDIFGFPLRVDTFGYPIIKWDTAIVTANTGFVGAVSTTATATSGDVRGTYALQAASDGTKRLTMFVAVSAANISSATGLFGVAQFTG